MEDAAGIAEDEDARRTRLYAAAQEVLRDSAGAGVAVDRALAMIGAASRADRAFLFMVRDDVIIEKTHEWCAPGVTSMRDAMQQVPIAVADQLWVTFRTEGMFRISDVAAMPAGAELRDVLLSRGVRGAIAVPLWQGRAVRGFVGLDFCTSPREVTDTEAALLRGFAATLDLALHGRAESAQRQTLQADLHTAQGRLAAMTADLPELLVETDADGIITGFHQAAPLIFALRPDEVIGHPPETVLPSAAASIVRTAMDEARRDGWSATHAYTLEIDGQPKRFTLHVAARRSPSQDGSVRGFMHVVRDITESFAQDTLVRQLGRVAELSTNLIMLTDADGGITWMNPAAERRTGVGLADALGRWPTDLLNLPRTHPDMIDAFCATLAAGHELREEVEALDRRGLPYWVVLNIQPLTDTEGNRQAYMAVANDVTMQKLAETRALRDRSTVFDASPDGIAISLPDGGMTYLNPVLRGLLGVNDDTPAETLCWHDIAPEGLRRQMPHILPQLRATGHWQGQIILSDPAGEERFFEFSINVQDDGSFLTISREVTARKRAEKEQTLLREQLQIAQSRQLIAQLAGGLAHDLANLLAVVTHSVETLKPAARKPPAREGLAQIEAATSQAQALMRNMARLNRRSTHNAKLDLATILRETAALLRPSLTGGAEIELDLPERGIAIHADRTEAMQVMLNLMLNARDALGADEAQDMRGRITVRLSHAPPSDRPVVADSGIILSGQRHALVEIADTGPGISQALRAQILKPYFTTRGEAGSGLGLAIVADILKRNGAALRILSRPGAATVMQVYWPLDTDRTDRAAGIPSEAGASLAGLRVLLVDNDDTALRLAEAALERAGAETASCIDPQDALDALRAAPQDWDVVVRGDRLDSMTGDAFAQRVRDLCSDLQVIVMSARNPLPTPVESGQNTWSSMVCNAVSDRALVSALLEVKLRRPSPGTEPDDTHAPSDR